MQDIVIRIREAIQAEIENYGQPNDYELGIKHGLESALAIIDQECFRREPAPTLNAIAYAQQEETK